MAPSRFETVDARALRGWLEVRFGSDWTSVHPARLAAPGCGSLPRMNRAESSVRRTGTFDGADGSWLPADAELFRDGFDSLGPYLERGELLKGVALTRVRSAEAAVSPAEMRAWLAATVANFPAIEKAAGVCTYAYVDERGNGFLGATPELLFEAVQPGRLRTAALAVTRVAADGVRSPAAVEFASDRERREHDLVLDHLLRRMARFGTASAAPRRARWFGSLCHLETPVAVRIGGDSIPVQELIRGLHPTPALGTAPPPDESAAARAWLGAHASLRGERAEFGAPFGVWDARDGGRGRILVAIRQVRFSAAAGGFDIPAGCGIVRGSRLEDEWEEALAKVAAVQELFFPDGVRIAGERRTAGAAAIVAEPHG